jgi:hypothetical protein
MANVTLEIETHDDDNHDDALKCARAFAELISELLGLPVSVSDGYGTVTDFGE